MRVYLSIALLGICWLFVSSSTLRRWLSFERWMLRRLWRQYRRERRVQRELWALWAKAQVNGHRSSASLSTPGTARGRSP